MEPTYKITDAAHLDRRLEEVRNMVLRGLPAGPVIVKLGRENRTIDQNSKLWPMLQDISEQVEWHGLKLRPEEWKDLATAALRGQKMIPGIDGGFVAMGRATSRMTKKEFSELIEYLYAFGSDQGVEWSEPGES